MLMVSFIIIIIFLFILSGSLVVEMIVSTKIAVGYAEIFFIYFIFIFILHTLFYTFALNFSFNCMRAFVKETHSSVNDLHKCPQKDSMDKRVQKFWFCEQMQFDLWFLSHDNYSCR
ncbi:hypothetical protein ACKWTF_010541 [Chironomus riparius]